MYLICHTLSKLGCLVRIGFQTIPGCIEEASCTQFGSRHTMRKRSAEKAGFTPWRSHRQSRKSVHRPIVFQVEVEASDHGVGRFESANTEFLVVLTGRRCQCREGLNDLGPPSHRLKPADYFVDSIDRVRLIRGVIAVRTDTSWLLAPCLRQPHEKGRDQRA